MRLEREKFNNTQQVKKLHSHCWACGGHRGDCCRVDGGLVFLVPWGSVGECLWRSCTRPSRAPTPPAGGCSCVCRTRCCRSSLLPGWISRTLCPAWTGPGTCHTQRNTVRNRPGGQRIALWGPRLLLVWDVYVELLPVGGRGPSAVEFGDDLDQMLAAQ